MYLPMKEELIIFSLTLHEKLIWKKYLVKLCHKMTIMILHESFINVFLLCEAFVVIAYERIDSLASLKKITKFYMQPNYTSKDVLIRWLGVLC